MNDAACVHFETWTYPNHTPCLTCHIGHNIFQLLQRCVYVNVEHCSSTVVDQHSRKIGQNKFVAAQTVNAEINLLPKFLFPSTTITHAACHKLEKSLHIQNYKTSLEKSPVLLHAYCQEPSKLFQNNLKLLMKLKETSTCFVCMHYLPTCWTQSGYTVIQL